MLHRPVSYDNIRIYKREIIIICWWLIIFYILILFKTFREKNRTSQLFNHLSGISESIGAFGWIAIQPAPSPYVKEMSDAAQFYTNRVLKDYKEKYDQFNS